MITIVSQNEKKKNQTTKFQTRFLNYRLIKYKEQMALRYLSQFDFRSSNKCKKFFCTNLLNLKLIIHKWRNILYRKFGKKYR